MGVTITPDYFSNFATSSIAGGTNGVNSNLNLTDTTLYVNAGDGALFPSSFPFYLVIGPNTTTPEIVQVTAEPTADKFTIVRGQGGTTALQWTNGTTVQHVIVAQNFVNLWNAIAAVNGGVASSVAAANVTAGTFQSGVILPASQLGTGAIPSGVTLPATQVTTGALPSGVTLPATQVTAGTLPSGVTIGGSQITGTVSPSLIGSGNLTVTGNLSVTGTSSLDNGKITTNGSGTLTINGTAILSGSGGIQFTGTRTDPASDTTARWVLSATSNTLDSVGGTSGWRFIPNSGTAYSVVITIDASGNITQANSTQNVTVGSLYLITPSYTQSGRIANISAQGITIMAPMVPSVAAGVAFYTWDGSYSYTPFSIGGQYNSAASWMDNSGNLNIGGYIALTGSNGVRFTGTGRTDPASDTTPKVTLSGTSHTVDIVGGTSGWRLIKNSGTAYTALTTVDSSGNLTTAGSITLGSGGSGTLTVASDVIISSARGSNAIFIADQYQPASTPTGIVLATWSGTASTNVISIGGLFGGAKSWFGVSGNIGGLAGQTTAGSLGVPPITSVTYESNVTTTVSTNVVNWIPTVAGLYRVSGFLRMRNGTSGNMPTMRCYFYDPKNPSAPSQDYVVFYGYVGAGGINLINGATNMQNNYYVLMPIVVDQMANQPITITYLDPTNTPNDFVSITIERLS